MNKPAQLVEVLNVRLPKPIVAWLDRLVEQGIFNSRSEGIREFSRELVLKERKNE